MNSKRERADFAPLSKERSKSGGGDEDDFQLSSSSSSSRPPPNSTVTFLPHESLVSSLLFGSTFWFTNLTPNFLAEFLARSQGVQHSFGYQLVEKL
jgi:hypothetical protein